MLESAAMQETEVVGITSQDAEHLRLLSIFHYIMGGIICVFGLMPLMHVFMGISMMRGAFGSMMVPPTIEAVSKDGAEVAEAPREVAVGAAAPMSGPPDAFFESFGILFLIIGLIAFVLMQALGVCTLISGRKIRARRARTFSLVVAGMLCLFMPFGTALGVCTIILLVQTRIVGAYQ